MRNFKESKIPKSRFSRKGKLARRKFSGSRRFKLKSILKKRKGRRSKKKITNKTRIANNKARISKRKRKKKIRFERGVTGPNYDGHKEPKLLTKAQRKLFKVYDYYCFGKNTK
jgi:hypothetical protein